MASKGWVSIYRELLDKPIWLESTPEQKTILITILLMANHEPKKWEWQNKQYTVKAGQFVTSLPRLAEKSGKGISVQNVRTALKRFEKLNFLTDKSTNKNRLITLLNWDLYQVTEKSQQATQQAPNRQLTANNNVNKKDIYNSDSKNESEQKIPFAEIIAHLNQKASKQFRNVASNQKLIKARWDEGYKLDDFKKVIDTKTSQWKNVFEMEEYLRPKTLFGHKFDQYLNEQVKSSNSYQADERELAMQQQKELKELYEQR